MKKAKDMIWNKDLSDETCNKKCKCWTSEYENELTKQKWVGELLNKWMIEWMIEWVSK